MGAEQRGCADVLALAHERGLEKVLWHVPETPPTRALSDVLLSRGATVEETLDRLALVMEGSAAEAQSDVAVHPVLDEQGADGLDHVDAEVFGTPAMTTERLPQFLAEVHEEWEERSGARVVAWVDGEPVGSGGVAVVGEVARLYGGATLPSARRRGVYGAMLTERLRLAREWGATLALVKGRIDTSAPILRRLGFQPHGREVTYRLPVAPPWARAAYDGRTATKVTGAARMTRRVKVGTLADFADGELHQVDAAGTSVVVGRSGEGLCAARNRCPHLGLPLAKGPGGVRYDGEVVQCPWHNSKFQLCSGENLDWAPGFAGRDLPQWSRRLVSLGRKPAPLTTYPVVVEDDDVYVEI